MFEVGGGQGRGRFQQFAPHQPIAQCIRADEVLPPFFQIGRVQERLHQRERAGRGLLRSPGCGTTTSCAAILVNLRHLLLGATLRPWFARSSAPQTYGSAFFLSDESWAITHREADLGTRDRALLVGTGLVLWVGWVTTSVLGYLAGGWVPDPARLGLDFTGTAVFIALLTGMWRGKGDLVPWLVAALVALGAARWLPGQWYIVLGGLAGSLCGMWRDAE